MATITTFLKLRVPDNLDSDSRFNLERIDTLARSGLFDSTGQLLLRSNNNIVFRPGNGVGGTVTTNHQIANFNINSETLTLNDDITFAGNWKLPGSKLTPSFDEAAVTVTSANSNKLNLAAPATLTSDLTFTFPDADGTAGQVLSTDGSGNFGWSTVLTSSSIPQTLAVTWSTADGTTKSINHGFNTTDIIIKVYDIQCREYILLDDVHFVDNNNVSLTVSVAPGASGFRVFLLEIL